MSNIPCLAMMTGHKTDRWSGECMLASLDRSSSVIDDVCRLQVLARKVNLEDRRD